MIRTMLAWLAERLLRGRRFNAAEARLIGFVSEALPADEREVLARQFAAVRKVRRHHPGRLVAAYYGDASKVPTLPYPGYEHCLADVTYRSTSGPRTTSVVLHHGRLMTLERNVPHSLSEVGALVGVRRHPGGFKSVATQIDAEEHGEDAAPQ